jgi:hypothetical protein
LEQLPAEQMKKLYEDFARKVRGQIEVRPLLFEDTELTVSHIRSLMAFRDGSLETPLYLEVIQNILRRLGRKSEQFFVRTFLSDLAAAGLNPAQLQMLDQRLSILKTFSAATAPDIVQQDYKNLNSKNLDKERRKQGLGFQGNCITVERAAHLPSSTSPILSLTQTPPAFSLTSASPSSSSATKRPSQPTRSNQASSSLSTKRTNFSTRTSRLQTSSHRLSSPLFVSSATTPPASSSPHKSRPSPRNS